MTLFGHDDASHGDASRSMTATSSRASLGRKNARFGTLAVAGGNGDVKPTRCRHPQARSSARARGHSRRDALGVPHERARTQLHLAEACRAVGRLDDARDALARAAITFEELGAVADLERIRRLG